MAILGEPLLLKSLPHQVCKLTLSNKRGQSFHCTGSHIAPQLIKTAAHCLYQAHLDKVECGKEKGKVKRIIIHPLFNGENVDEEIPNRRFDHALIQLTHSLKIKPFNIPSNRQWIDIILEQASHCFLAGYGINQTNLHETGHLSLSLIKPIIIQDQDEIRKVKGAYIVDLRPGDSGSPLLCLYHNRLWDMGTASGRDFNYDSLFAPIESFHQGFPQVGSYINQKTLFFELNSNIHNLPSDILDIQLGQKVKIRPFSQFYSQEKDQFFFNGEVPVDFTIEKLQEREMIGIVEGGISQFYICVNGLLCWGQKERVSVPLNRLLNKRKRER